MPSSQNKLQGQCSIRFDQQRDILVRLYGHVMALCVAYVVAGLEFIFYNEI
ncbi:hypothetical protein [Paenibacillus faecalis]|uniref:hypothetical protein n=1 Tax=Paenibacillus faecalis TaxID=2079532 RepID=UPI00131A50CD|nr:hypothetical protein [Paenibacillus faecalis]